MLTEAIDPLRDIETINLELILSDLEILERRIAKVAKGARMDKEQAKELSDAGALSRSVWRTESLQSASRQRMKTRKQYFKNLNLLTA